MVPQGAAARGMTHVAVLEVLSRGPDGSPGFWWHTLRLDMCCHDKAGMCFKYLCPFLGHALVACGLEQGRACQKGLL